MWGYSMRMSVLKICEHVHRHCHHWQPVSDRCDCHGRVLPGNDGLLSVRHSGPSLCSGKTPRGIDHVVGALSARRPRLCCGMTHGLCSMPGRGLAFEHYLTERSEHARHPVSEDVEVHRECMEEGCPHRHSP